MLLALALALLLGILAGIITGLTPGIHINLVAAVLLGLSPVIAQHAPLWSVAVLIVAMGITHTFLDTIPSTFLGAPDNEHALGVLPGHRYLLSGNGMMAVKLCVLGGITGILLAAILFIPSIRLIALLSEWSADWLFWILLALVLWTVLQDQKRAWACLIFLLSGLLGVVTFRLPMGDPLLPMLSGLFGAATLIYSMGEINHLPTQKEVPRTDVRPLKLLSGSARGVAGAFLTALYPGVSSAMAASVTSRGKIGDHGFLILLGALGGASFLLGLASWLGIEKARNGALAVAVSLAPTDTRMAFLLIGAMLVATGVAALITLWVGTRASRLLPRMPYRATCIGVLCLVAIIVGMRTGWLGLLVFLTSTTVGLLPAALKTARAQAMGCLMLPLLLLVW